MNEEKIIKIQYFYKYKIFKKINSYLKNNYFSNEHDPITLENLKDININYLYPLIKFFIRNN